MTGVAADDVLNIRALADADADIIAGLAPDATDVEVVFPSLDGRWGQIRAGERTGWVAMRFLSRQPGQTGDSYPAITACYGNEPYWSLETDGEQAQLTLSGETLVDGYLRDGTRSANRIDIFGFAAGDAEGEARGVLRRELCSDGMSDRLFGLSITLIYVGARGHSTLSGCCVLSN
ncbi:hypothetical protein [Jannaschia pohangensis]|uniref:SH3 domain-containing protein n=1 Tax=Jannaschia pohangensis TaxID=390807 RepID=A0A1I3TE80_9RHOB|nr:hypothetical protein [Jannaschia pohangensis]SFJ68812.1 hypothetical protein SAMN04488095_3393 [Jannaschia pohangensis]